ncbi:hypothetical protein V6N12_012141 [Hibiscus sabdariffa]|uniref:Bifunctional inhibitor/plant lipid transfer protein/seed storage helical domain-containing protein n=1 Tax=Hibiscus sabdariffa TaxID=183260 RepID=A0ABR2CHC0_9ROSI
MRSVFFVVFCAVVLFSGETRTAEAVTCNPTELSPCLPAFVLPVHPTAVCCRKLKKQQPCLCEYMKDPRLKPYLESPKAKGVASYCKITWPQC